jgi:amino acid adenylation domain-containing protein
MQWKSLNLSLEILSGEIRKLPLQNIDLVDVIEVLWAIVLQKYTGSDRIALNRVVDGKEAVPYVLMDLNQDEGAKSSDFPCLASFIEARRDGTREPFILRAGSDNANYDTTIWITSNNINGNHPSPTTATACDIFIEVKEDTLKSETLATIWYRFPRFSDWEVYNLSSTLKQSMRCLPAAYHSDIRELDLLSPENREDLRRWMPSQACSHDPALSVPDILKRKAQTQANACAVEAWDGIWTYYELEEACKSLAVYLYEVGVRYGDRVLLRREKSKWTVVAMIATLMAGGVCVPVDIRQPKERVNSIIQSTGARFLLTSEAMARKGDAWTPTTSIQEICVPVSPSLSLQSSTNSLPTVTHDTIAFIFFTSGSTGIPKGVVQEHGPVAMTAVHISKAMRMNFNSRTFQYSSYSFDVSVGDTVATFFAGGCLCVPSEEQRLDDLSRTIDTMKATHICITPTILAKLAPQDVPSLRQVTVGGESLTKDQLQKWCPRIATIYGTTESVIWDTYHADLTVDDSPRNIGRGMGPTTTWIVDPRNTTKLMPVGAIGELLVGGPLLSRGYLNDEDRTKVAFLEKPLWLEEFLEEGEATQLYRTGDLVRYNFDGTIQYIGRKDRQIKVNGQRVELGDIEYALRQTFPDGTLCAAEMIHPEFRQGQEVLAAFISVHPPVPTVSSWSLVSVRKRMSELLPMYMVPSLFIPLEGGIPTTSTGKVDRSRLRQLGSSISPAQVLQGPKEFEKHREPMTPKEALVQRLCGEALGITDSTSIDMNSNFFQYGGTSIHAMHIVALARSCGFSLSVVDVFENPRLIALADILRPSLESITDGKDARHLVAPFSLLPSKIHPEDAKQVAASCCGTKPSQIHDVFPCTVLQESLLALSSKNPGDYIQQAIIDLPSTVDLEQFREAYEQAADQIPILRCRAFALPQADHRIHMAVIEGYDDWLTYSVLDQCSDRDRQELSLSRLGDRLVKRSFVIDSMGKRYFVWTIHHALFDGWSFDLVLDEIERQYLGRTMPPLPFQNFVYYLQNEVDYNACRNFWRSRLEGADHLRFPPSLPSAYQPSGCIATVRRVVSDIQWPATGVTPAAVLQGAWAVLLSQHSVSPDVVFGSTVIGRHAAFPGIEHIAGPTIATVPVRVFLDPNQPVSKYVQQLQVDTIHAVPYEQLGLAEIARVSADAEKACGFQTLLVIQPPAENKSDINKRLFDRSQVNAMGTLFTYAVTLQCWLKASGSAEFQLELDEAVLNSREGERLLAQLEAILLRICVGSMKDATVATILHCSDADMAQVSRWNIQTPDFTSKTVLELIGSQVAAHPNRLAVDAWDGSLTYRELELRASQLAQQLQLGEYEPRVPPTVVISLEKSHLAVIAFIAVLKIKGVCVLVDPALPSERLKAIIERSQAHLALTTESQSHRFSRWMRTITISTKAPPSSSPEATCDFPPSLPTDDACIVFTSGSTGEPKAICWPHQAVAVTALELGAQFNLSSRSRVFQFSSYAFDVSIHETLATLVHGGCLCIPSEESRQNALQQTIASFNACTIILTPSTAQLLAPEQLPSLEKIVFCGEPLPETLARKWSKITTVYNWYGPAECSLATCCQVGKSWRAGTIGVGGPTKTWIVNPQNHDVLQPIGAVGELLLQGPCVASRYAHDDVRTAQGFIDPPRWWQQCQPGMVGTRLYKTGDLARYASDGSLILLGRKDTQVKIHGQRVELAEIEGSLRMVLGVDRAVMVDLVNIKTHRETLTLAAFIQTKEQDEEIASLEWTEAETIQGQLSETLPTWMVPRTFFSVQEFPWTTTGKVDRRKLQDLGAAWSIQSLVSAKSVSNAGIWRPVTEADIILSGLWIEILGLSPDQIAPQAHFIQLGGNSIDAMRLVAAGRRMGYSLSVRDILAAPCLTDLSRRMQRVRSEASSIKQSVVSPFSLIHDTIDSAKASNEAASQCRVPSDRIVDVFPCTALQTALLALTSKRAGDYVSRNIFHVQGPLSLFRSSWQAVVTETPILRSRIVDLGGEDFYQVVIDEPVEWNDKCKTLEEYLHRDRLVPMGLGTPLVRWGISPGPSDQSSSFSFIWTIHHSLYDGWSFQAILDQVERVYTKQPLSSTTPFQEFVKYTMDLKRDQIAEQFWKQRLDGAVAPQFPILPSTQYQARATSTMEYRATPSQFPARENYTNYTWSTILRAAWSLVLARYSRSSDVVFGATVLGRQAPVPGVDEMIGPTIATIPVRVRWSKTDTIHDLLQTIHEGGIEMNPFEQVGLQKIRRLGPGPAEACNFQTMLIVQPSKEHRQDGAGLFDKLKSDDISGAFSSTALTLRCSLPSTRDNDGGDSHGIRFHLDFDPSVVDKQQARRILRQMDHTLLQLSLATSSTRICDLQLLSCSDMEEILFWNENRPEPIATTVTELFRDIVRQFPAAPAVHAWDAELSYEELDRCSTNVAHRLVSLGVHSQQRVPLYFEKSAWAVVAIFGVLKAGGTAVLLEPSQPDDRISSIVNRIKAPLMVTSQLNEDSARRLLPSFPVVVVDSSVTKSPTLPPVILEPPIGPSSPLYVVFTSGSTGAPKGVVITHGNICSALKQRRSILPYQPGDRILDGVSYAFDVCWGNILFSLCSGACLCVPATVNDIGSSINQFRVTVAGTVPSIARQMDCRRYPSLKTIILGGESARPADIQDWAQRVNVFNSYGPAECTVSVCLVPLNGEGRVHVGRGLGATMWIVDDAIDNNCLASIGSIGELWLEGPQVGLGYLDDPDSSAASFIESEPAWLSTLPATVSQKLPAQKNRRFYRTGDLAQYYPDGMVRLIGRLDTQAKLRGQRIELEEVEHHVKKLIPKGIEVAAEVIIVQSSPSRQFLVLFVVPDPDCGLHYDDVKSLRQAIGSEVSKTLPSYMCPSAYVPIPMMPRLAAGKVNRGKLREIGAMLSIEELTLTTHQNTDTGRVRMRPLNPLEAKLRDLWATCLGLVPGVIGAEDSFLQHNGGDSISAMRLVRLAQEQGMCFSVADVFRHPTLCDLATKVVFEKLPHEPNLPFSLWRGSSTVNKLRNEAAACCDVRPEQVEDIFPCTALQEGLLALTSMESNMYTCREVFELHEDTDISRLRAAWNTVAASMPILRTRIIDLPPHGLHQVIVNEPISWGSRDTQNPMTLGSRLVHWALIENENSRQVVWTIHHSLYDGWSIPRILEQVDRAYYQETLQPYLSMQPFIQYLSEIDEGDSRAFWKDQLSEAPSPSFPTLPSVSYEAKATESCGLYIPDIEWPVGVDVTPTVWIRAAWALLIGHIANTDDLIFGATVSGRQVPVAGIQDIIGPTIATVPVRIKIDWATSIKDFARQLQQQAADMIPFEQIGLHRLRYIGEDAKQGIQFRTLVNVQSALSEPYAMRVCTRNSEPQGQFNDFAVILDCELRTSGIFLRLDFDKNVIQPRQAERLIHQLETILLQLTQKFLDSTRQLADFNPISNRDLSEIWQWNSVLPEDIPVCFHDIIHDQVLQRPDALAVDAWDGQLTYGALDQHAAKLASHLQDVYGDKVGPENIIALYFEKSMWTVVAALAVMKTGSAFTLMDASQPEERLRTICSQVNQDLIISSASNANLAAKLAKHVLVVDHNNLLCWSPPRPMRIRVQPNWRLYVVFTSGSTGTPKGVIITHSNFSSAVKHQGTFLGYNTQTRVYDFASYSFDIALSNLLHCLAAGGCLCIPSDAERKHSQLAESMERMQVNLIDLTPSVARTLDPTAVPSLKTLVLGGEAALRSDILRWAPYVRVLNGIGQAECTVTTTMAVMDPSFPGTPGIGKAIGTNTWIVSPTDHHQLTAIGAVGELLVEGPLVGDGYLNDEEKTSASFIQHPRWLASTVNLSGRARNGRLYKTGDLVRYDADGGLHFIGRKDAQAKIRGQRIELEEVEYHVQRLLRSLSMEASVSAEALVLSGAFIQNAVLVVFVCPATMADSDSDDVFRILDPDSFIHHYRQDLNSHLESELPSAMVPFVYVPVNRIPLSPTGKTDRKRLKALGASLTVEDLAKLRGVKNKPKRAPSTPIERQVRDLWAEILAITADNIGIDDNFVQLGGDSISAMRLVSLAQSRGLMLDSRKILHSTSSLSDLATTARAPTSATLGEQLPFSQLQTDDITTFIKAHIAQHVNFPLSNIEDIFPVTEFQAGCIKAAVQQKPPSFWNYFYLDFQSSHVDTDVLSTACRAIALHFPILRTAFVPFDGGFLQVVTKDWVPEFVQFSSRAEDIPATSERIAREDLMDVEIKAGTRFARFLIILADDEPKRSRLVIRMSHALYDGISLDTILQALSAAIEGRQLTPSGSFASFIQHSISIKNEASRYWGRLLAGSSMTKISSDSPADNVNKSTPYIVRKTVSLLAPLPKGITAATFFTACWAAVVAFTTQQTDIVFGRLVSGRGATLNIITEPVAGPCLNVIPLRVTWPRNSGHKLFSPHEVFATIQQQQLNGMPFESTGLSDITSCADWPANTTFGSVFQYQNIDETPEVTFFGAQTHFGVIPMEFRPEQLWVLVKPLGHTIEVTLFGTTAIMTQENARFLRDEFCNYVAMGGMAREG